MNNFREELQTSGQTCRKKKKKVKQRNRQTNRGYIIGTHFKSKTKMKMENKNTHITCSSCA